MARVNGPINWDAELRNAPPTVDNREKIPPARDGLKPLTKDSTGAAEFVEATGWSIHPVAIVKEIGGGVRKVPTSRWRAESTADPDGARRLWDQHGGVNAVGVDAGKSNLVVADQDVAVVPPDWEAAVNGLPTLTLASATRGAPHYVYQQPGPPDAPAERIGKGRWPAGDVLGDGGYFLMSSRPVIRNAAVEVLGGDLLKLMQESVGPSRAAERWKRSRTALARESAVVLDAGDPRREFMHEALRKFRASCAAGTPRRQAALDTSWYMVIEASAGVYPLENALEALREAYEYMREVNPDDRPGDGWTTGRARDFETMCAGAMLAAECGELDEPIEQTRDRLREFIETATMMPTVEWDEVNGRFRRAEG